MPGRYAIYSSLNEIADMFDAEVMAKNTKKRYNATPSQNLPVIVNDSDKIKIDLFSWGLIPSWSKDRSIATKTINARAESVTEKPSFRNAFRKRRCLIPANGFYEWNKSNSGKKAVYITPKNGHLFTFAGLWEKWQSHEETIYSFTIITTVANNKLIDIHHRMPVILNKKEERDLWLNNNTDDDDGKLEICLDLLVPCSNNFVQYHHVSNKVNSACYDSIDLIQPIIYEDQDIFF